MPQDKNHLTASTQAKNGSLYAVIQYKDETGKRKNKWKSLGLKEVASKRKFLYMLQNGYIDYEDNGNKTHRYSLKMSDVETMRKEMNEHPERFAGLSGRFTAQKTTPSTPRIVLSPSEAKALRNYLEKRWRHHPDSMPSKLASELTGLTIGTLNRHVANGNLIGAVIGGKMLISKQNLIGHRSSPETVRKVGTEQLQKLLAGYKKRKN